MACPVCKRLDYLGCFAIVNNVFVKRSAELVVLFYEAKLMRKNTGFEGQNLVADGVGVTLRDLSQVLFCSASHLGIKPELRPATLQCLINCFHLQLSLVTANKVTPTKSL